MAVNIPVFSNLSNVDVPIGDNDAVNLVYLNQRLSQLSGGVTIVDNRTNKNAGGVVSYDSEVTGRTLTIDSDSNTGGGGGGTTVTIVDNRVDRTALARVQTTTVGDTVTITLNTDNITPSIITRANADSDRLTSEISRATGIETGLRTDLNNEVTNRGAADNALRNLIDSDRLRINTEIAARTSGDTALGVRIDSEIARRTTGDAALGARIDGILGNVPVLVDSEISNGLRNNLSFANNTLVLRTTLNGNQIDSDSVNIVVAAGGIDSETARGIADTEIRRVATNLSYANNTLTLRTSLDGTTIDSDSVSIVASGGVDRATAKDIADSEIRQINLTPTWTSASSTLSIALDLNGTSFESAGVAIPVGISSAAAATQARTIADSEITNYLRNTLTADANNNLTLRTTFRGTQIDSDAVTVSMGISAATAKSIADSEIRQINITPSWNPGTNTLQLATTLNGVLFDNDSVNIPLAAAGVNIGIILPNVNYWVRRDVDGEFTLSDTLNGTTLPYNLSTLVGAGTRIYVQDTDSEFTVATISTTAVGPTAFTNLITLVNDVLPVGVSALVPGASYSSSALAGVQAANLKANQGGGLVFTRTTGGVDGPTVEIGLDTDALESNIRSSIGLGDLQDVRDYATTTYGTFAYHAASLFESAAGVYDPAGQSFVISATPAADLDVGEWFELSLTGNTDSGPISYPNGIGRIRALITAKTATSVTVTIDNMVEHAGMALLNQLSAGNWNGYVAPSVDVAYRTNGDTLYWDSDNTRWAYRGAITSVATGATAGYNKVTGALVVPAGGTGTVDSDWVLARVDSEAATRMAADNADSDRLSRVDSDSRARDASETAARIAADNALSSRILDSDAVRTLSKDVTDSEVVNGLRHDLSYNTSTAVLSLATSLNGQAVHTDTAYLGGTFVGATDTFIIIDSDQGGVPVAYAITSTGSAFNPPRTAVTTSSGGYGAITFSGQFTPALADNTPILVSWPGGAGESAPWHAVGIYKSADNGSIPSARFSRTGITDGNYVGYTVYPLDAVAATAILATGADSDWVLARVDSEAATRAAADNALSARILDSEQVRPVVNNARVRAIANSNAGPDGADVVWDSDGGGTATVLARPRTSIHALAQNEVWNNVGPGNLGNTPKGFITFSSPSNQIALTEGIQTTGQYIGAYYGLDYTGSITAGQTIRFGVTAFGIQAGQPYVVDTVVTEGMWIGTTDPVTTLTLRDWSSTSVAASTNYNPSSIQILAGGTPETWTPVRHLRAGTGVTITAGNDSDAVINALPDPFDWNSTGPQVGDLFVGMMYQSGGNPSGVRPGEVFTASSTNQIRVLGASNPLISQPPDILQITSGTYRCLGGIGTQFEFNDLANVGLINNVQLVSTVSGGTAAINASASPNYDNTITTLRSTSATPGSASNRLRAQQALWIRLS